MRYGFIEKRLGLAALCVLGLAMPIPSRTQEIPPPPTLVGPVIRVPDDYGGFKTVAPCLYDAMGPDRRKALLDAYRSGGRDAYARQMEAYNAFTPTIAKQCNPLTALQLRQTILALNGYLGQTTALALLNEFGVTQAQLDGAVGPKTAPLFDYIHANAVAIVTGDEKDRREPVADTPKVLATLMASLHLTDAQQGVGREAVWAYYMGRETLSVLNDRVRP